MIVRPRATKKSIPLIGKAYMPTSIAVRRRSLARKRDPVTGILADNQLEPDPSPPRLKMLRKQQGWPHLIIAASDRDNLGLGPFHGNAGLSYTVSKRD